MIYAIAHDLKAPLRGITGFTGALVEDHSAELSEAAVECVGRVRRNAERLGAMIEALLSLGDAARLVPRPDRVDLAAIAREVLARHGVADPGRKVEVVAPAHLWARADARLARTLVEVLIDNAWKFTGPTAEGRIEIGVDEVEGTRVFFIRDNGVGFPMDYAKKLFRPLQRLHGADEFPGMGVGLAIARRIVHRHGGRIRVDAAEGVGATVYFTLPVPGGSRVS